MQAYWKSNVLSVARCGGHAWLYVSLFCCALICFSALRGVEAPAVARDWCVARPCCQTKPPTVQLCVPVT